MRRSAEQTIPEELMRRIAELTTRVAELASRLELIEGVRANGNGNGNGRLNQQTEPVVYESDDSSSAIEYLTENGFSIVRPWENGNEPAPSAGTCRFLVADRFGKERAVHVEIAARLIAETEFRTRGRIQPSSSFWICCAERHLADHLWEHDAFPPADSLLVETLDAEEMILAGRWGGSR